MQEMLDPTSYLKARRLGMACALVTGGRFSGGTAGLSIGHVSPEAAAGSTPAGRGRTVSTALQAYALFAASVDLGAVRRLPG